MKKHPVDDLFKSKLSNLEKTPSASAWERIEREQKKSGRRLGGWIWYAAAGIVVIMLSGYLVWQHGQVSGQMEMAVAGPQNIPVPENRKDTIVARADEQIEIAVNQEDVTIKVRSRIPEIKSAGLSQTAITDNKITKVPVVQEPDREVEHLADLDKKDISVISTKPLPEPDLVKIVVSQPMIASNETKEGNRTIVVNVQQEEESDKNKTSRFTKVFRQLKNARAGEPVDWKDVGFNPKTIVARVDETIRDKEETISERYQDLKQRTKL